MSKHNLHRRFRTICRKAGILLSGEIDEEGKPKLVRGAGFHSMRTRTITNITKVESSEISIHSFVRWAMPRQFSMLARYRQTSTEESDMTILQKHPTITLWEQVIPYLFTHNRHFKNLQHNHSQGDKPCYYEI